MTPLAHFRAARVLIEGAQASVEHVISRDAGENVVAQQTDWIIGELEHAVAQLRQALAKVAPAESEFAEAAE